MALAILIVTVWIMSTCFHEFGHAIVAYWGGDKSVKDKGYLTLNPIVYFNSATTLVLPIIILIIGGVPLPGAAVYINSGKIKSRFMQSLVSFAGPLFTWIFLIGIVIVNLLLPGFKDTIGDPTIYTMIKTALSLLIYLEIFVFILNLLPIPPLDGYGIIEPWLPANVRQKMRQWSNFGFLLIIILFMYVKPVGMALQVVSAILAMIFGADVKLIDSGFDAIQANSYGLVGLIIVAWIIKSKMPSPTEKADKLLKEQKYEEAIGQYDQALTKSKDPRLLAASATCCLALGRKEDALQRSIKAVDMDPENAQTQSMKAICLSETGATQEAIEAADLAIKYDVDRQFPMVHMVRANSLSQLGRNEEALESIEKFLPRAPNNADGLFIQGNIFENLDRYDDALATYDKAARWSSPGNLRATLAKSLLLCALGRSKEGLDELGKVLPEEAQARKAEFQSLIKLMEDYAAKLEDRGKQDMANSVRSAISEVEKL